jgi:hypothetical protein
MDVLDEKQNGAPPMEIDEVVSVRDREFPVVENWRNVLTAIWCRHLTEDEAFAAKHMPDLGHDVKDFQVFTWRLNNWKKLDKKLTSPEFDCGGHKWFVDGVPERRSCVVVTHCLPGAFYYSPSAILMHPQMIPFQFILTMQSPRKRPKDGMLVPSLP